MQKLYRQNFQLLHNTGGAVAEILLSILLRLFEQWELSDVYPGNHHSGLHNSSASTNIGLFCSIFLFFILFSLLLPNFGALCSPFTFMQRLTLCKLLTMPFSVRSAKGDRLPWKSGQTCKSTVRKPTD